MNHTGLLISFLKGVWKDVNLNLTARLPSYYVYLCYYCEVYGKFIDYNVCLLICNVSCF